MRHLPSTPISSRRGVARISAVWMIVVVVLLFVVLGYAYIAQDEAATAETARVSAVQERVNADARLVGARDELRERSQILGFTTDAATVPSNIDAAKAGLVELGTVFPNMGPDKIKTYQDAIQPLKDAYRLQTELVATLRTRITELEGDVAAATSAKNARERELQGEIDSLNTQITDAAETAQSEIDRLDSAKNDLQDQVNAQGEQITALQDEVRDAKGELDTAKAEFASVGSLYRTRLKDIEKRAEKPDGEITAVSASLGTAYINLKASDRLSEGIEFDVVSGQYGNRRATPKARVRVIDVGPTRSEVQILAVVDPLGQPVVTGDKLYNPLFEAKGERNAVLAGNISGTYNEPELRELFKEIGINVQENISNTTDFLITGGPVYIDDEGEPLEEPMQPEDLPVYGEARDLGVVVIPVRDVMQYFRR